MQRLTTLEDLNAGDTVTVGQQCRIPECRGRSGHLQYMYAAQPEFGTPAEFIVSVDGISRPLMRTDFDPA